MRFWLKKKDETDFKLESIAIYECSFLRRKGGGGISERSKRVFETNQVLPPLQAI